MIKNTSKRTTITTSIPDQKPSAGSGGIAITPPAYGIEFLDHGSGLPVAGPPEIQTPTCPKSVMPVIQREKVDMADGGKFESSFSVKKKSYDDIDILGTGLSSRDELIKQTSGISDEELVALKGKRRDLWGGDADMTLSYRLPGNEQVKKVGLVQITKPTVKARGEGWKSFAAKRGEKRMTEGGWYFDRQEGQSHPVFGMQTHDESGTTVDYVKLSGGEEEEDRRGQYGTAETAAVLHDRPSRISPLPFEHEFQTAALVVDADSPDVLGKYLGIVSWSYGHDGKKVHKEDIKKVRDSSLVEPEFGGLTHVFRESIKAWNKEKDDTERIKNIQLPTDE